MSNAVEEYENCACGRGMSVWPSTWDEDAKDGQCWRHWPTRLGGCDTVARRARSAVLSQPPAPTLKVKRVGGYNGPLPSKAHSTDSGFDLRAAINGEILNGMVGKIPTGISIELPEGYEGQVRPRSGMSLRGHIAVFGTIDQNYRGEIGVMIHNTTSLPFIFKKGDKIAQLCVVARSTLDIQEVEELTETDRGEKGFGSTGV